MDNMKIDFIDKGWLSSDEFILYGFGEKLAIPIIDDLLKRIKIVKIIDNNKAKWGFYKGIPIVGSEELGHEAEAYKIVVALSDVWYLDVSAQLSKMGMRENIDYCQIKTFFHDYYYAKFNCNSVFEVQSILTSKCTLNCEKCIFFIPFHQNEWHYGYEQLKKDYDVLFRYFDYVPFISLIGGETLLYGELRDIIDYLDKNYSHQYGNIFVPTNGMVVPDALLLESLRNANVRINISDYTSIVNYKSRLMEVCDVFRNNEIPYSLHTFPASWSDLGFPEAAPAYNTSSVREHMLSCNPDCKGYYDGKLYFCDSSWSAEKCGLFTLASDDCVDLRTMPLCEENKRKVARFCMGIFENKDYISMCAVCNGIGPDNPLRVCPGVQKHRNPRN